MPTVIEFETPRLRLRRWREADREPFAAMNADPAVMAFFEAPQSRAVSDASVDAWQAQFAAHGWSNWAVELRESGEFIGFTGLSVPRRTFSFSPCVEVGWRLARRAWGKGFATEAARASLRIAFEQLALPEVVSYTAVGNVRSRAVMERIGMLDAHQEFEHPGISRGHPLRLHCLYRITRAQWAGNAARPGPRGEDLHRLGPLDAIAAPLMKWDVSEVVQHDAPEVLRFMEQVIATAVAADAAVRAEMTENAGSNLHGSMAQPQTCCHLKCVAEGRIVGVVLVKNFWNLCSLFVAPEYHRRGIGRALVSAAMDRCRGRSERQALWLNAATNAVPFYRELGFRPRPTDQALPPGFQAMQIDL